MSDRFQKLSEFSTHIGQEKVCKNPRCEFKGKPQTTVNFGIACSMRDNRQSECKKCVSKRARRNYLKRRRKAAEIV